MIARVPSAAPTGPPLTGASSSRTPTASACPASSAGVPGATVECTATVRSPGRASRAASSTSRDLVVVSHHDAHQAHAGRQVRDALGDVGAGLAQRTRGVGVDVVHPQPGGPGQEPPRHRPADGAEPDEADGTLRHDRNT